MSDGAKTGTPSNTPIMDAAMGWHDRRDLLSQIGTLEMALTEALKVAGEALDYIEGEANVDEANGDTLAARLRRQWVSVKRAALERLKSKTV